MAKKPTIRELESDILTLTKKVNFLLEHSIKMETTIMSYIAFKNDNHKYNDWLKQEIKKQKEKETQNDNSNTKDGGHAGSH